MDSRSSRSSRATESDTFADRLERHQRRAQRRARRKVWDDSSSVRSASTYGDSVSTSVATPPVDIIGEGGVRPSEDLCSAVAIRRDKQQDHKDAAPIVIQLTSRGIIRLALLWPILQKALLCLWVLCARTLGIILSAAAFLLNSPLTRALIASVVQILLPIALATVLVWTLIAMSVERLAALFLANPVIGYLVGRGGVSVESVVVQAATTTTAAATTQARGVADGASRFVPVKALPGIEGIFHDVHVLDGMPGLRGYAEAEAAGVEMGMAGASGTSDTVVHAVAENFLARRLRDSVDFARVVARFDTGEAAAAADVWVTIAHQPMERMHDASEMYLRQVTVGLRWEIRAASALAEDMRRSPIRCRRKDEEHGGVEEDWVVDMPEWEHRDPSQRVAGGVGDGRIGPRVEPQTAPWSLSRGAAALLAKWPASIYTLVSRSGPKIASERSAIAEAVGTVRSRAKMMRGILQHALEHRSQLLARLKFGVDGAVLQSVVCELRDVAALGIQDIGHAREQTMSRSTRTMRRRRRTRERRDDDGSEGEEGEGGGEAISHATDIAAKADGEAAILAEAGLYLRTWQAIAASTCIAVQGARAAADVLTDAIETDQKALRKSLDHIQRLLDRLEEQRDGGRRPGEEAKGKGKGKGRKGQPPRQPQRQPQRQPREEKLQSHSLQQLLQEAAQSEREVLLLVDEHLRRLKATYLEF